MVLCGISTCFQVLSPCVGQIAHALLTRPPLEYRSSGRSFPINIPARLACVKHAASVRPEPGSNSYVQSLSSTHRCPQPTRQSPLLLIISSRRFTLSESDCSMHRRTFPRSASLFLYKMTCFSVSFSRIAVVVSFSVFAALATTLNIIAPHNPFVNTFFQKPENP